MESTLTETEALSALLITIGIIVLFFTLMWVYIKWFPSTSKIRLAKKRKGRMTFYRAEVWRPIFGWTPIWTSRYSGIIDRDGAWTSIKISCIENIETFKKLKNVIENEETIY